MISVTVLTVSACVRVPEVENRLQSLRFHPNMYVVQAGDTIESIAHRYQLTSSQLAALNRHTGGGISPGDRINVRPGTQLSSDVRQRTGSGWLKGDPVAQQRPANAAASKRRRGTANYPVPENYPVPDRAGGQVQMTSPAPQVQGQVPPLAAASAGGGSAGYREEIIPDDYVEETVVPAQSVVQGQGIGQATGQVLNVPVPVAPQPVESTATVATWQWPAEGEVAREYAPNEVNGQGIDIAGVPGQQIVAAASGTVAYTGRDLSNSGKLVIVRHNDDLLSTYSHAQDLFVAVGEFVEAGDPIANLGWNAARESVLHFEVRRDGKPVNPMLFLPAK